MLSFPFSYALICDVVPNAEILELDVPSLLLKFKTVGGMMTKLVQRNTVIPTK